jgi:hypothetical protein
LFLFRARTEKIMGGFETLFAGSVQPRQAQVMASRQVAAILERIVCTNYWRKRASGVLELDRAGKNRRA